MEDDVVRSSIKHEVQTRRQMLWKNPVRESLVKGYEGLLCFVIVVKNYCHTNEQLGCVPKHSVPQAGDLLVMSL